MLIGTPCFVCLLDLMCFWIPVIPSTEPWNLHLQEIGVNKLQHCHATLPGSGPDGHVWEHGHVADPWDHTSQV